MSISISAVQAKAKSFADAIAALPPELRTTIVSNHYARTFNTLVALTVEILPGVDVRLVGEPITIRTLDDGTEVCDARYVEIDTYVRQIMEQLAPALRDASAQPASGTPAGKRQGAKTYCVDEIRKAHAHAYGPWEPEDDARLEERHGEGANVQELALEFGRQPGGIRSRLRKLGLTDEQG